MTSDRALPAGDCSCKRLCTCRRRPSHDGHRVGNSSGDCSAMPSPTLLTDCHLCGGPITQRFYLRLSPDLFVHEACLRCHACWTPLHGATSCYLRDGRVYCHKDYRRLFLTCAACGQCPSKADFVRRFAHLLFHASCLRCQLCGVAIGTGQSVLRTDEGLLLCAQHSIPRNGTHHRSTSPEPSSPSSSCGSSVTMTTTTGLSPTNLTSQLPHLKKSSRSRSRTVLSEAQVHTLRQFYEQNPRPDTYIKEQLASLTGLSTRVIRVWFQNNRCKDKKRRQQTDRVSALEELRANTLAQRKELTADIHGLELPSVGELHFNEDASTLSALGLTDSDSPLSS